MLVARAYFMGLRIGIVHTRGIGDIMIALPIADHYIEKGCEVVWPIDELFFEMFQKAKPEIFFLPIPHKLKKEHAPTYFYHEPMRILKEVNCDHILNLYSHMGLIGLPYDEGLFATLKFDEYKYAVAKVPFSRKWTLKYERDHAREQALYERLNITGPYVLVHDFGSDVEYLELNVPPEITDGHQVVRLTEITDNVFDWRLVLERAAKLVMIDSSPANLVEGLNLPNEKYLLVRSDIRFTPVYRNGWQYVFVKPVRPQILPLAPAEEAPVIVSRAPAAEVPPLIGAIKAEKPFAPAGELVVA